MECIISIFLIIAGILIMANLFHSALRYQTMVTERVTAATLAERQMERIRGWSQQMHKSPSGTADFDNASWASCPGAGAASSDPLYPGYAISVVTAAQPLYSPCSQFELKNNQPQPRKINTAARRVDVYVRWGANREFVVSSIVALPTGEPKAAGAVQVSNVGNIAIDGSKTTSASLTNADNRTVPDVFFDWEINSSSKRSGYLNPVGPGVGTAAPDRDGRSALIANFVYATSPPDPSKTGWAPGDTLFVATTRYRGRMLQGAAQVLLQP